MDLFNMMTFIMMFSVTLSWEKNTDAQYHDNSRAYIYKEPRQVTVDVSPKNKVKLKVFYESLCPGSMNFLTNHLRPAVETLGPYLDIHLVPYGHAKTREISGHYFFVCQHGPEECFGNKLHACAAAVLGNETQAVLFNACLMQYTKYRKVKDFNYARVVNWCNYKTQSRAKGIWTCVNGNQGSTLLKAYGDETRALKPPYVPYVIIGDTEDQEGGDDGDLVSMICHRLDPAPPPCEGWRRVYP